MCHLKMQHLGQDFQTAAITEGSFLLCNVTAVAEPSSLLDCARKTRVAVQAACAAQTLVLPSPLG